jgi:hypothetical protein
MIYIRLTLSTLALLIWTGCANGPGLEPGKSERASSSIAEEHRSMRAAWPQSTGLTEQAPSQHIALQMTVGAADVIAGQSVTASCEARDGNGNLRLDVPLEMTISPAAPVLASEPSKMTYAPNSAGSYMLGCRSTKAGIAAAAPAHIQVVPSVAQALEVKLAHVRVTAGESVEAVCMGRDAYGNDVVPPSPQFVLPSGVQQKNHALKAEASGSYSISCTEPAWSYVAASPPVPLSVGPADPVSVKTWVSRNSVQAHTLATVHCEARDIYDNPAPLAQVAFVVTGGEAQIQNDGFIADKAGKYQVNCFLPEATSDVRGKEVQVAVTPGAPARWQVQLHRQGKCFSQGRLPILWQIYDAFDNEIDDAQVALSTNPERGVMRDASGGYMFLDEAEYDITLAVVSAGGENLQPWHEHIVVDSTPPRLEITAPLRGAMLEDKATHQVIQGHVYDKLSALTRVVVAGVEPPLDQNNPNALNFSVTQNSNWGLNLIQAQAEDACGNVALVSQSYLRSGQFGPAATEPRRDAAVSQGVRVRFNQRLWDDNDRTSKDDVATLLQLALVNSQLDERLPQRLWAAPDSQGNHTADEVTYNCIAYTKTHKSGIEITRNGPLTYENPEVQFVRAVEGGWHISFVLRNLRVPLRMTYYFDGDCLGGSSQSLDTTMVSRETRIEATAQVSVTDGEPTVSLCPSCVHVSFDTERPRLQVNWGFASRHGLGQGLDNWLNWLTTGYSESMTTALEGRVRHEMMGEMEEFLRGLRLEHSLPLPAPWRGTIQVASGLDAAELHGPEGSGYGEFGLYTQIFARDMQLYAPGSDVRVTEPILGPIRRDAMARADLGSSSDKSFALAVHDDLLNQMLWALWYGGAFTQRDLRQVITSSSDASESSLLDASTLRLFFTTPPVVMPGDAPGEIKLGVGDAYAEADCDLYGLFGVLAPPAAPRLHAGFYFSTVVTAHLGVDAQSGHLVVTPVGTPQIHVQVTQTSNPSFQPVVTTWLERALNRTVPPMLAKALGSFPLPVLQINRMAGVDANAVWRLHEMDIERPAGAAEFVMRGTLHEGTQTPK